MTTIASPRRSGSIRGVEGGVKRLIDAIKKKQSDVSNQRPCVGAGRNHRKIRPRAHTADFMDRESTSLKELKETTSGMATIVSPRRSGSIRGVEGGVEKILASIKKKSENLADHSPLMRRIRNEEMADKETGKKGKVVLYVTSVQMVRSTRELCRQVVHILKAHRANCTVRDVYLHPAYNKELSERLGGRENVSLPQLFINGEHIGDGATVMDLNEAGELEELLTEFMTDAAGPNTRDDCAICGGKGFIMCLWCKGSKKGMRNSFGDLKCTVCNENALQECPGCSLG